MENLVTNKPTFLAIGGSSQMVMPVYGEAQKTPENITKIIENVTTVDMTGVEDAVRDLIMAIQTAPMAPINVAAPQVNVEAKTPLPTFHVEAPNVVVEPKIEVHIPFGWILAAALLPTIAILVDIYVRIAGL